MHSPPFLPVLALWAEGVGVAWGGGFPLAHGLACSSISSTFPPLSCVPSFSEGASTGGLPEGARFRGLLGRLSFYMGFEIEDQTGEALTPHQVMTRHLRKVTPE